MMRKKCLKSGHKFSAAYPGAPYVFCTRLFCSASAVSLYVPDEMATSLHNAIPKENRWPPMELDEHGNVIADWTPK